MKIFKRQYRIVKDSYSGFEVQKRLWYFPFWFQIKDEKGFFINTNPNIKQAEKLIEIDKTNQRVIKTFKREYYKIKATNKRH